MTPEEKHTFMDFVREMLQYLDDTWTIEELPGYDYIKLRGSDLACLSVYVEGHPPRISVHGQFEVQGNPVETKKMQDCQNIYPKAPSSCSYPMSQARRAASRVNQMLPGYYVVLQQVISRKVEWDHRLEQAQTQADELIFLAQGTLKRYRENWEDGTVTLSNAEDAPDHATLEIVIREEYVHLNGHNNYLPIGLMRLLAAWLPLHGQWDAECEHRLALLKTIGK